MAFSEPQVLEFPDLQAVNAAIKRGDYSFQSLLDEVVERAGVPRGTAYGRMLRALLEKTERHPEAKSNEELEEEVRDCIRKETFTLRLGRCLVIGWVGWKE